MMGDVCCSAPFRISIVVPALNPYFPKIFNLSLRFKGKQNGLLFCSEVFLLKFNLKNNLLFLCILMHMHVSIYMCICAGAHAHTCIKRPEDSLGFVPQVPSTLSLNGLELAD